MKIAGTGDAKEQTENGTGTRTPPARVAAPLRAPRAPGAAAG